jgi:hypothetical protein
MDSDVLIGPELHITAEPVPVTVPGESFPRQLSGGRVRLALLLAPLLLLVFVQPFKALTDPDYWWHVRTGQYIVDTGTVPRVDPYSYTLAGQPWTAHEWLSEVLFFLVSQHFGYVGNVVLFGLIGVATALIVYVVCRLWGVGEMGAALVMVWASALAEPAFNVRPQVFTSFLFAVCILLLSLYKRGTTRALWPLPLVFALWVNLHGGYAVGLGLLALTVVGEALAHYLGRSSAPVRPLLVVTGLSTVATLLNPRGVAALVYPITYLRPGNAIVSYILEWQSPNFHEPIYLLFAASLLLAAFLGVARGPLGPTEVLWALTFAFLGLDSARHVPLFAVAVMPLVAARLQAELPALRASLESWHSPVLLFATSAALLAVVASTTVAQGERTGLQTGWEPNAKTFPSAAIRYLRAHDIPGNLFAEYAWGGYVIYNLYPERRVFIDGRIDLYGFAIGRLYDTVINARPEWQDILSRYDVRVVLVGRTSPLAGALEQDSAWQVVEADQIAALFVRR